MSKPERLPEWATDTDYPAGSEPEAESPTKVEPLAGKKAIGWRPAEKPSGRYLNDWMYLVYLWLAYLDAGALEGDVSITDDLDVGGNLDVVGNAIVGSDASVAGNLVVGADVVVGGAIRHGERTLLIGLDGGAATTGTMSVGVDGGVLEWVQSIGGVFWKQIDLGLIPGVSRIKSVAVIFEDNTVPSFTLFIQNESGTNTYSSPSSSSGMTMTTEDVNTGWSRRKGEINTPIVMPANSRAVLMIENDAVSELHIVGLEITYDAPA